MGACGAEQEWGWGGPCCRLVHIIMPAARAHIPAGRRAPGWPHACPMPCWPLQPRLDGCTQAEAARPPHHQVFARQGGGDVLPVLQGLGLQDHLGGVVVLEHRGQQLLVWGVGGHARRRQAYLCTAPRPAQSHARPAATDQAEGSAGPCKLYAHAPPLGAHALRHEPAGGCRDRPWLRHTAPLTGQQVARGHVEALQHLEPGLVARRKQGALGLGVCSGGRVVASARGGGQGAAPLRRQPAG